MSLTLSRLTGTSSIFITHISNPILFKHRPLNITKRRRIMATENNVRVIGGGLYSGNNHANPEIAGRTFFIYKTERTRSFLSLNVH